MSTLSPPPAQHQVFLRFSRGGALAAILLGALVLLGWQLDIEVLKRVHPSLALMNPMTALCFVMLGLSTWWHLEPVRPWRRRLGAGLASGVAAIALLKLCSLFPGGDFGIDHLLFRSLTVGPGVPESHMAINSALCLLALAVSLLAVDAEYRSGRRPGQYFAASAVLIGYLVLVGYAFNLTTLNRLVTLIPMALHSAVMFVVLGLGSLFLRPDSGLMRLVCSPTTGGHIMRRVLPVFAITPLLLGMVRFQLEALGDFKYTFGLDLMVAALLLIDVAAIWLGAASIDRLDRQQRQTAEALRESQRTQQTLLSNLPGMAYRCRNDAQWTMEFVSEGCLALTGYSSSDLVIDRTVSFNDLTLAEDRADVRDAVQRSLRAREPFELVYRIRHAAGDVRWVWEKGRGVFTDKGDLLALEGLITDITERKRAEEELARLSKQNELILSSVNEGILGTDDQGRAIFVNPAASRALGYEPSELVGQNIHQLLHYKKADGSPYPIEECAVYRCYTQGTTETGSNEVYWHKDGTPIPIEYATNPIVADGQVVGSVINFRDITERKRIEAELRDAKDKALQASLAKSEFLATMSHEIRTPMNAIIGMAELLGDTPLNDEQRDYVRIFTRAGESLLSIINDILDLSKVEAGQFEMESTEFNLDDLLEKSTEMLALRAHEQGLELACYVLPQVPPVLVGDPHRLRQILVNLVNNAVKFTEQGEVLVRLDWEPVDEHRGTLVATVTDTGIGIATEKLRTLFEPFTQADSSTTRRYGGTGLGLAICKRLVELMGGRIWVESRFGEGSTFGFAVPLEARGTAAKKPQAAGLDLTGVRALVVDDNSTSRLILREILTSWGADVLEAPNGPMGLEHLRQSEAQGRPPTLILLDCRMPSMDGFEVAEKIRGELGSTTSTILMLTSDNRRGDIQRSRSLGLAAYLVKPIRRQELRDALSVALGYAAAAQAARRQASQPEVPEERILKLLLVDDSEDNRLLVHAHLKKTPHQVDFAENGAVGVERFMAGHYDLVFMDIQMPVMDGYEATRRIRAWEAEQGTPPTPVIALTANAMAEDLKKSMEAGCTSHLAKPVKKADLLKALVLPASR